MIKFVLDDEMFKEKDIKLHPYLIKVSSGISLWLEDQDGHQWFWRSVYVHCDDGFCSD